jgi:hypothetical protein
MIPLYWSIQNVLRKNPKEIERLAKQSKRLESVPNEIQA